MTGDQQPAKLPVGIRESLRRVDEGLAASEADLQGLFDLVHLEGQVPAPVTSLLKRKQAQLGYLREDLEQLPERLAASS